MTPAALTPSQKARLIGVLGLMALLAPMGTDIYLPAFDRMALAFATDHRHIELSLSAFFFGLAVSQLFYGPLLDRFGRRGPLLIGGLLYLVATVGCLLTRDITMFIVLRALAAVGGCAGMIVGRAIVHDISEPTESARALSLLMMLVTLGPIVAPVTGGLLLLVGDWPLIFGFTLAFAAVALGLAWRFVPETLPVERRLPLRPAQISGAYLDLLRRPAFVVPIVIVGLATARMFSFITGSGTVLIGHFKVGEQVYGWLFALHAVGSIACAQLNRSLLRRWPPERLLTVGLAIGLAACVLLILAAGQGSLILYILPLLLAIASLGLTSSNAAAVAMQNAGAAAGSASALVGALQFGCGFLASVAVAGLRDGTARPMSWVMLVTTAVAVVLWGLNGRRQPAL